MKLTNLMKTRVANAIGHLVSWLVESSPNTAWENKRALNKWINSPVAKRASETLGLPLEEVAKHLATLSEQEFASLAATINKAKYARTESSVRGLIKGDYYVEDEDVDAEDDEDEEEEGDYVHDPEEDEDPDVEADGLYPYEYPLYDPNGPSYFTKEFYRPPIITTLWRYGSVKISDIVKGK